MPRQQLSILGIRKTAQHNKDVENANRTARCKPAKPGPVDSTETPIQCSEQERTLQANVLLGAVQPGELPASEPSGTSLGEAYESIRTTSIARKQLASLALHDVGGSQRQEHISVLREVLKKPSLEELRAMTADGAASRDATTLAQLTAILRLENYVEDLEIKRLMAVLVAQRAEKADRDQLAPMRRAVATK